LRGRGYFCGEDHQPDIQWRKAHVTKDPERPNVAEVALIREYVVTSVESDFKDSWLLIIVRAKHIIPYPYIHCITIGCLGVMRSGPADIMRQSGELLLVFHGWCLAEDGCISTFLQQGNLLEEMYEASIGARRFPRGGKWGKSKR
jgi:hypothetical protein